MNYNTGNSEFNKRSSTNYPYEQLLCWIMLNSLVMNNKPKLFRFLFFFFGDRVMGHFHYLFRLCHAYINLYFQKEWLISTYAESSHAQLGTLLTVFLFFLFAQSKPKMKIENSGLRVVSMMWWKCLEEMKDTSPLMT